MFKKCGPPPYNVWRYNRNLMAPLHHAAFTCYHIWKHVSNAAKCALYQTTRYKPNVRKTCRARSPFADSGSAPVTQSDKYTPNYAQAPTDRLFEVSRALIRPMRYDDIIWRALIFLTSPIYYTELIETTDDWGIRPHFTCSSVAQGRRVESNANGDCVLFACR